MSVESLVTLISLGNLMSADIPLAYVGPGAGLSAFGALLALVSTLILVVIGFVWYPMKRLLRIRRAKRARKESSTEW